RFTGFGIYDMNLQLESALKTAARVEKPERDLNLPQLVAKIQEYRNDLVNRPPHEAELHKRFAFPVAAIIFALLGFPLSLRSSGGRRICARSGASSASSGSGYRADEPAGPSASRPPLARRP